MEKHVLEEVSKLQSEQNVLGVLVSDTKGLCIFSSGEVKPGISGHVTFIANQLSKLDKHDLYPTIVLKSDNNYLRFIYDWSNKMTSIEWWEQELNLSENTVIDWNNYLHEVCAMAIENKPQGKIFGPGKVVEIDES